MAFLTQRLNKSLLVCGSPVTPERGGGKAILVVLFKIQHYTLTAADKHEISTSLGTCLSFRGPGIPGQELEDWRCHGGTGPCGP